jgi:hypothetical protein
MESLAYCGLTTFLGTVTLKTLYSIRVSRAITCSMNIERINLP